ncbi:hypothetical protein PC9H_009443 [Pleurotus ostreatus]|uniref:Glycoside hydrolase family 24 protein n=1 Tax=Pleurotus ostreatus TaxID=5322 RepID=A0A8H6ZLQ8_PLEOS|nr:uncharacterized protein PC9H_009443 [Pleurotus ostreatus]KAF7424140.1 hypothetical protein PC9H_009443 [Pleurotus ostreatus]KAJ8693014.1 hypothetical protein PTI98_010269 [Pleurotus ostreatus]
MQYLALTSLLSLVFSAPLAHAAVNGACSVNGTPGVCLASASCTGSGGTTHVGFCPNDPADIKCCTKTACGSGGNCRFTSSCSTGNIASGMFFADIVDSYLNADGNIVGLCPGPTDFKCCLPASTGGGACPPAINSATVSLIKEFEGFVARPAPDPIGLPTVGYGHLCQTTSCSEAGAFPLTEARATTLLLSDSRVATSCLNTAISRNVRLNANQFGALTSWTFNVGCGNMRSSSLLSRLNAGEAPNTVAAQELPKWNKAGGQVLAGLTRRRAAEVVLFQTASSVIAHPC